RLRTSNLFTTWTFTVNVQQGGHAYKLRVVNQAIRRRMDLPLVDQLVECCVRDAELARGVGFSQSGHTLLPGEAPQSFIDVIVVALPNQRNTEVFAVNTVHDTVFADID